MADSILAIRKPDGKFYPVHGKTHVPLLLTNLATANRIIADYVPGGTVVPVKVVEDKK